MKRILNNNQQGEILEERLVVNKKLALVLFLILYIGMDTFLFGTSTMTFFSHIMFGGYVIAGILSYVIVMSKKIYNKKWLLFTTGIILLSAFANVDLSGGVLLQISVIAIGCYLSEKVSLKEFTECYDWVMFWVAISSLIVYALYYIMPNVFSMFPIMYDSNNYEYIFLGVSRIMESSVLIRNSSFFREPGVYTVFLTLALIITLFGREKVNGKRVLIYIITIITTLSTAGFVIIITVVFLYFISNKNYKFGLAIVPFFLALIYFYQDFQDYELFIRTLGKFNKDNEYYGSTVSRHASFVAPLQILMDNPVFGAGLANFSKLFSYYTKVLYHEEMESGGIATNTYMDLAATYGVFILAMILNMLYRFSNRILTRKSLLIGMGVFVIIILALSNEDVRYSAIFSTILFYGFKTDNLHRQFR